MGLGRGAKKSTIDSLTTVTVGKGGVLGTYCGEKCIFLISAPETRIGRIVCYFARAVGIWSSDESALVQSEQL